MSFVYSLRAGNCWQFWFIHTVNSTWFCLAKADEPCWPGPDRMSRGVGVPQCHDDLDFHLSLSFDWQIDKVSQELLFWKARQRWFCGDDTRFKNHSRRVPYLCSELRTISPKGEWLHAVAEDNTLPLGSTCNSAPTEPPFIVTNTQPWTLVLLSLRYCFSVASGGLEQTLKVAEKEASTLSDHG